jgi:large subunit ribosomal protein L25
MERINGSIRNKKANHDARRERRKGFVPGILYGKNIENILFEVGNMELEKNVARNGEHGIMEVNLNGEKHKTIIKEIQKDVVNHKILHIDLEELYGNSTVDTEVPINFSCVEDALKNGQILQKLKSKVKIRCEAEHIPNNVNIDVSALNLGECIRISDVETSSEISIIDDLNEVVAAITVPTAANIPDESNEE